MNPVFKKLNFKDQPVVHIIDAPASFDAALEEMKPFTKVKTTLKKGENCSFFLAFCTKQLEVEAAAAKIADSLEGDGVLWFAYPKGSSKKYTCDFNRDTGWTSLGALGFEPVRAVAIDEDWTGMRFRKVEFIKKMTRSAALSEKGKVKAGL